MNPNEIQKQLELAAYEMAEAEGHERAAKALRVKAAKRIASTHAEIADAIQQAYETKNNQRHEQPTTNWSAWS